MDKLPDHDFGEEVSPPQPTTAEVATPETACSGTGIGKNSASACQSSPKHELSGDGGGGGLSGVEGGDGGPGRNNTGSFSDKPGHGGSGGGGGGEGGASTGISRLALSWVASDEGEVGPHTAVAARNAEWATVARDVRFRLAAAWLSCEQVYICITPPIVPVSLFFSNVGIFASALFTFVRVAGTFSLCYTLQVGDKCVNASLPGEIMKCFVSSW